MQTTSKFFPEISGVAEDKLFQRVADYFAMLSDPSRLKVLSVLCAASTEVSVNEIVGLSGMAQPNVSRHLSRLYAVGIAERRRKGTVVFYKLQDSYIRDLCSRVVEKFRDDKNP